MHNAEKEKARRNRLKLWIESKNTYRIFLSPIQICGYGLQPAQITKVQRDGRSFSKENPMPASLCSRGGAAFDKSREHVGTHIYIALSPRRHGSGPTQDIAGCDTLQQLSSTLDEISKWEIRIEERRQRVAWNNCESGLAAEHMGKGEDRKTIKIRRQVSGWEHLQCRWRCDWLRHDAFWSVPPLACVAVRTCYGVEYVWAAQLKRPLGPSRLAINVRTAAACRYQPMVTWWPLS
jgi:hypothetical protein